jgi:hypothetical protein
MRWGILAPTAVLALVATACGGALRPTPSEPVVVVAERDGVRVTLSMPQRVYGPREVAWADVTIENLTDRAVSWVGGGCNFPARVSATVPPEDPGRTWAGALGEWKTRLVEGYWRHVSFIPEAAWDDYRRGGSGPICTADIRINELPGKGVLTLRAAWDGDIQTEASRARVPNGTSRVRAAFPLGTLDGAHPLVATVAIELVGGATLVSGSAAIDAALEDQRFRSWLEQRLAAERPDQPIVGSVRLRGGVWMISVLHKVITADPTRPVVGHEADVAVDGKSGNVLSVDLRRLP